MQSIAEVLPLTVDGEYEVNEIYTYNYHKETLERVGEAKFESQPLGGH